MLPHYQKDRSTTKLFDFADPDGYLIGKSALSVSSRIASVNDCFIDSDHLHEKPQAIAYGLFV